MRINLQNTFIAVQDAQSDPPLSRVTDIDIVLRSHLVSLNVMPNLFIGTFIIIVFSLSNAENLRINNNCLYNLAEHDQPAIVLFSD